MSIDAISGAAGNSLMKELLRGKTLDEQLRESTEELKARAATLPQDAYRGLSSKEWDPRGLYAVENGSMTNNFMKANQEQSRYTASLIDGFKSDSSVMAEMDSMVTAMASSFDFATNYAEAGSGAARAQMMMRRKANKENMEAAAETHLKETREELKRKTAEMQAPKDKQGDPLAYAAASDPDLEASAIAPKPVFAADAASTGGNVSAAYETIGSMAAALAAAVAVDTAATPASETISAAVETVSPAGTSATAAAVKVRAVA